VKVDTRKPRNAGTVLLLVGALAGIGLAGSGINQGLQRETGALPARAIASVNGIAIPRAVFERALRAMKADLPGSDTPDLRRRALSRLIDEELLVQRALELGLASRDPRLRADLSAAMIDLIVARASEDKTQPTEAELRVFYRDNPALFRTPPLLRVERWKLDSLQAAQVLLAQAGKGDELPRSDHGQGGETLPGGWLPPAKLQDYLGPTAVRTVLRLQVGGLSKPLRIASGWQVLRLVERRDGMLPDFDSLRPQVLHEYQRRGGDRRLRDFLAAQRSQARIEVAEPGL